MRQVLDEHAITVFSLLAQAAKLENYDRRFAITVSTYPHMDEEGQEQVKQSLQLPDDLLSDILEDENYDEVSKLKDMLG